MIAVVTWNPGEQTLREPLFVPTRQANSGTTSP